MCERKGLDGVRCVLEALPGPATRPSGSLTLGSLDLSMGSACGLASLASCPYHTGRAEGALCGPSHELMAGQAVDWVFFFYFFILLKKFIN